MVKRDAENDVEPFAQAEQPHKHVRRAQQWIAIPGYRDVEMSNSGQVRRISTQAVVRVYNSAISLTLLDGTIVSRGIRKIKALLFPDADFDGEEWRIIQEHTAFEVSNKGRIRSVANRHICAIQRSKGYCRISFGDQTPMVHVLVAKAFLAPPSSTSLDTVNHINGIKHDNDVENLEWASRSEQLLHAHATGLVNTTNTRRTIHQLKDGAIIATFASIAEAARSTSISQSSISDVCNGSRPLTFGFGFEYAGESKRNLTTSSQHLFRWVPVHDFPLYEICMQGLVRHAHTHEVLAHQVIEGDYTTVTLYKDGSRKPRPLHILLARAFLPNPDNLPVVNHIDENKQNNDLSNLQWVTSQRNTEAALGRVVYQYNKHLQLMQSWPCAGKASLETGIPRATLTRYCRMPEPVVFKKEFIYTYCPIPTVTLKSW